MGNKMAQKKGAKKSGRKNTAAKKPAKRASKAKPIKGKISSAPEFKLDLAHNPEKYLPYKMKGSRLHYFTMLMMLTIFNFLLFLALVPLMIIIKSALLMLILGGIGLVFGMFYLYMIRDIEHLRPKHHLFAGLYIPLISVLNIIALFFIGRLLENKGGYDITHLLYSSAIYAVMFILPYAIAVFFERLWPRKGSTI